MAHNPQKQAVHNALSSLRQCWKDIARTFHVSWKWSHYLFLPLGAVYKYLVFYNFCGSLKPCANQNTITVFLSSETPWRYLVDQTTSYLAFAETPSQNVQCCLPHFWNVWLHGHVRSLTELWKKKYLKRETVILAISLETKKRLGKEQMDSYVWSVLCNNAASTSQGRAPTVVSQQHDE